MEWLDSPAPAHNLGFVCLGVVDEVWAERGGESDSQLVVHPLQRGAGFLCRFWGSKVEDELPPRSTCQSLRNGNT